MLVFDGRVHPETNEHERNRIVQKAQRALRAVRSGEDAEALEQVAATQPEQPVAGEKEARDVMLLLFGECSAMVDTLGDGGTAPVKVQVFDEQGAEVSIDNADPPVRTAVRTLLAQVHGNAEDADEQLAIALANATPDEVSSLLLQALRWTIRLADECLERDLPVADWVADAA